MTIFYPSIRPTTDGSIAYTCIVGNIIYTNISYWEQFYFHSSVAHTHTHIHTRTGGRRRRRPTRIIFFFYFFFHSFIRRSFAFIHRVRGGLLLVCCRRRSFIHCRRHRSRTHSHASPPNPSSPLFIVVRDAHERSLRTHAAPV